MWPATANRSTRHLPLLLLLLQCLYQLRPLPNSFRPTNTTSRTPNTIRPGRNTTSNPPPNSCTANSPPWPPWTHDCSADTMATTLQPPPNTADNHHLRPPNNRILTSSLFTWPSNHQRQLPPRITSFTTTVIIHPIAINSFTLHRRPLTHPTRTPPVRRRHHRPRIPSTIISSRTSSNSTTNRAAQPRPDHRPSPRRTRR